VAGIITILATYLFSWYAINIGTIHYVNGIGIIVHLPDMFLSAESLGTTLDIPFFALYIIAGLFILFLISGILQIIGVASRAVVIIGSIMPILLGVALLMTTADIFPKNLWIEYILGTDQPLIADIIPLKLLPLEVVDIGAYLLFAGGAIGFIAGILPRD
jgi:hypothetical protein